MKGGESRAGQMQSLIMVSFQSYVMDIREKLYCLSQTKASHEITLQSVLKLNK